MKNQSIILIITYFGPFPWYFNYFLHSCGFNLNVDFLIITDNKVPDSLPVNVKFENRTLKEIRTTANKRLGFEVALKEPYKLCDFKPAYGYLFPELIEGYDFWGHGDLDVIYGNIRNFITPQILFEYDIVTILADYISGAFTLFRNCKKINELFKQSKDYVRILSESKSFCFDETNNAFLQFADGLKPEEIITEIESMTHVVKMKCEQKYLKAYFNTHILEGLPGRIKWQEGTLIYKNEFEVMMFHLILLKHVYQPKQVPKQIGRTFYIPAYKNLFFKSSSRKRKDLPIN